MENDKDKAFPRINALECKSCGRCLVACPKKVLVYGEELNSRGYLAVRYLGTGCIGCGNCFYSCPEPYAIEIQLPDKK